MIEDELDRDEELLRKQQEAAQQTEDEEQGEGGIAHSGAFFWLVAVLDLGAVLVNRGLTGAGKFLVLFFFGRDKRNWDKIVCLILAFFAIFILPGAAVAAFFSRDDIDFATPGVFPQTAN